MASAKAKRIYYAGKEAYDDPPGIVTDRLLRAIALMLEEATKPKKKVKAATKDKGATLAFSPQALYELCLARVPHIIACEPYDKRWFGRLGKVLQSSSGLVEEDMETLVAWIEGGALDFGDSWSFEHVIKHFSNWMSQARAVGPQQSTGHGAEEYME